MENLEGLKFNRLFVVKQNGLNKYGQRIWECKCDCGNTTYVITANLKSMKTKSCGCALKGINKKHSLCGTRLHSIHRDMIARCYNPNRKSYKSYGGRGISVCDEWRGENGLRNFYDWSISNGYKEELTIDRIDVNGNYEPENCMWATREEQANNTRRNLYVSIDGETHTLSEWCKIKGLDYKKVYQRVHRLKWDYKKALEVI